jgi:hypothetical protein
MRFAELDRDKLTVCQSVEGGARFRNRQRATLASRCFAIPFFRERIRKCGGNQFGLEIRA